MHHRFVNQLLGIHTHLCSDSLCTVAGIRCLVKGLLCVMVVVLCELVKADEVVVSSTSATEVIVQIVVVKDHLVMIHLNLRLL